jgi:hypothetical protein
MMVDLTVINIWLNGGDAEFIRSPHQMSALGCCQESFGGDTASVQAIAAHAATLNQYNINTKLRGGSCNRETAGPGSDDA